MCTPHLILQYFLKSFDISRHFPTFPDIFQHFLVFPDFSSISPDIFSNISLKISQYPPIFPDIFYSVYTRSPFTFVIYPSDFSKILPNHTIVVCMSRAEKVGPAIQQIRSLFCEILDPPPPSSERIS